MSYNFVVVTIDVIGPDGSITLPEGGLHLQVSDFVWDATAGQLVVVPAIDLNEVSGGYTGSGAQVPLLAMDNATLNTGWTWLLSAGLLGVKNVPTRALTVHYANGPTQSLTALLAASTLVTA